MNPDRVEWSGDTVGLDEVVEPYAYPGEQKTLSVLARRFPGVRSTASPAEALYAGLYPLTDGLERMGHGEAGGSPECWSLELATAYGAVNDCSDLVEAWRLFAQLPEDEGERVIAAAPWPM